MSRPIDPHVFVESLLPVVQQCARASLIFYGQVADIGKARDTSLVGSLAQEASGALTVLDRALQDILLGVVLERFPQVRCIAEEDTPLRRRFAGIVSDWTLILDPIDGTYHFLRGDAPYHISVGLAHQGLMQAAVVARPTEGKVFTAVRDHGAYVRAEQGRPRRLRLGPRPRNSHAFISTKARCYRRAAEVHLQTRDYPTGAALVLTLVAEGELCAYLTRQVEVYDVGPPSLVAEEAGARCFLRRGQAPRYRSRRRFDHYLCAATPRLEQVLLAVLRTTARGSRV